MDRIRTRFAPSPTGFMHLGVLRTALYAWLYAKKNDGNFILRIEDTDRARYVEGAVEVIYNTLKTCGLFWDEGPDIGGDYAPYIQSERMKSGLYMKYALELIEKDAAYYCFCPPESENCPCRDLKGEANESQPAEFVIRQKSPKDGETSFYDKIFGEITVPNSEIEDQILIKSDGMPTYNFANVIDDHTMNITHIIRGTEFLSSTPKYILLYESLGWTPPAFIHVAPIMRDSSHKLSKREGDAYFSDFTEKGYLVEAVINYIALLGWAPGGENEFFTLDELADEFDLKGISKSPSIFDETKMRAINAHYIRNLSPEDFKKLALPYIGEHKIDYALLCAALQPRAEVLSDITPQVDFIEKVCAYEIDLYNNKKMKTSPETALVALKEAVCTLEKHEFNRDSLYNAFKASAEESEVKIGYFLYPLQVALTGKQAAPGGGLDICIMLGKDESIKRIKEAVEKLS
ncbi:MAG: glutamate--tRNA ligase [Oscillospiraceae bacterium]|nr:glutamate--tRNA ligase [Oscillospiraceae bacterium]